MRGFTGNVRFYNSILINGSVDKETPYTGSLATIEKNAYPTLFVAIGKPNEGVPTDNGTWKALLHTVETDTTDAVTITYPESGTVKINVDTHQGDTLIKAISYTVSYQDIRDAGWSISHQFDLSEINIKYEDVINGDIDYVVQAYTWHVDTPRAPQDAPVVTSRLEPNMTVTIAHKDQSDTDSPMVLDINIDVKDDAGWKTIVGSADDFIKVNGYYSSASAVRKSTPTVVGRGVVEPEGETTEPEGE